MSLYDEINEEIQEKIQTEGFLLRNELIHWIDLKFGYRFDGKKINDNLISESTWRKYLNDFFGHKNNKEGTLAKYTDMLRGGNRNREYHIDFIKEVIEFKKDDLIEHLNSNKKTIKNPSLNYFAEEMNLKFDTQDKFIKGTFIKEGRVIKTQYEYYKEYSIPILTEEEREGYKQRFMNQLIDILIDKNKIEEDIEHVLVGNELYHGQAEPLEIVEDEFDQVGFKVDWTNYLKESVINQIKTHK